MTTGRGGASPGVRFRCSACCRCGIRGQFGKCAYAALIRNCSTRIYFDPFAEFGDLILGAGLVAAAAVAIFDSAWSNRAI